MDLTVGHRPFTAEMWDQTQATPCGIYGERNCTGYVLLTVLRFSSVIIIPPMIHNNRSSPTQWELVIVSVIKQNISLSIFVLRDGPSPVFGAFQTPYINNRPNILSIAPLNSRLPTVPPTKILQAFNVSSIRVIYT